MMTTRKRVGPLLTHRLAVRHSVDYSSLDHFALDDSLRDSSQSSSSETSSDPSPDDLSDSSSDHSLLTPSSGMRPSHHLCSLVPSIPRSSTIIFDRPSHDSSSASPSCKRSRSPTASVLLSSPIPGALSFAEINECIAYADALRVIGIDARFVVEAIESVQRDQGHRIIVTGQQSVDMMERIRELERDNRRLRDIMDVASQRVASDDLRDALSVIFLTYAHSRRSVSIRCQGYIGDFVLGCHAKDMVALYSVMLDSDESEVTYTEVSSPFKGLSDIGPPRADDHEYLELPGMPEDQYVEAALQAPPSPDYVLSPEEPEQAPPSPNYVPGPEHADDEIIAEDQPYAKDASPTAQSPDYVPEFDPKADPKEDDDEDPEEDPVDEGDDGDDEEGSSEDDEDDDMDIEADDEEEEGEHPAPANSVVVALPAADQAPSAEETEPVVRLLAISTPPSSPLSPWSSPLTQIPYPSLPLSPPSPVLSPAPPPSPIHTPSSGIPPPLPISVPTSSPPLLLPSTSRREDRPEVILPPRKRLGIALGPRYEVGEISSAAAARPVRGLRVDYGFVATMDREIRRDSERAFKTRVRQDTDEIYTRLDDEQSQRQLLAGRVNMLFRDRRAHAYTRHLMKTEARLSREAWRRSMDASDFTRGEVMSLRTTVLGQMSEIRELHVVDRRRQAVTLEMLKVTTLQGQVTALQGQVTALQGQQGPAGGPAQPELPEEAGSSS
ncbi:hypothetical protein Tco_0191053 [Tanacetum coccineum]